MKLFSEEVRYTSTNSPHNILQIENFSEIFFDVFEIEINKSKYPVEKISEHNGNPVVSVPVLVEDTEIFYPFILIKGKFELIFNENNTISNTFPDGDFEHIKEVPIVDSVLLENDIDDSFIEEIHISDLIDNKKDILLQIESAKKDASKAIQRDKVLKLKQISEQSKKHNKALENTLEQARANLVDEFISISDKLRKELVNESHQGYSEIQETLNNKLTSISENLESQLEDNFQNASNIFDKQIKTLVKELYSETVSPKLEKELNEIAFQIVEKVGEIETTLDKKLETKAEKTLVEGVSKELTAIQKANIELNDNINRGVNKALSRAGNVKILVEKIDKEINEKISDELTNIENYFEEKIQNITNQTYDITEESRKYIIDLVNKSKVELLEEIRKIPTEKPIEYIIESTKKDPEKVNLDKLKKEYDSIIHNKFENYKTDLRKYISVYSGGGSVAMQFADGGTMNGNLLVVGSISASEYLGINVGGEDTLDTVTTRGNSTDNPITVGGLTVLGGISADRIYTTQLDAISANITVIDIKQYELSGFNVQGDCSVQGSVSANRFVTLSGLSSQFVKGDGSLDSNIYLTSENLNSNVILFPTTTSSGISDYRLMVSSITDVAYDDPAVNVPTGPIDSADTYISTIISSEGVIVGDIDTVNMTVIGRIRKTGGGTNKNATFHFHVYKRSSDGTETSIGVSGDTLTVTSSLYEEYSASVLLTAYTWLATDRLVLKLYGILIGSGSGSSPTYDFEFGGETPVRILIPLPTSVQLSNYVPYIGATKDVDLGIHTITANNLIYNGGNTNSSNLTIGTNDFYNLNLETAGSNRLTILSNGNVGIGITTPTAKLDVLGNTAVRGDVTITKTGGPNLDLIAETAGGPSLRLTANATGGGSSYITSTLPTGALELQTNSTTRMTIASSGNVGIGITTPTEKLTVGGTISIDSTISTLRFRSGTGVERGHFYVEGTNQLNYRFGASGGQFVMQSVGAAAATNNAIVWYQAAEIWSEGANILAQRRSTNQSQEFRLYNTYTSATSAERATFKFDANRNFTIGTETLPLSGPQRSMLFQTASATRMTIDATGQITTSANLRMETPTALGSGTIAVTMSNTPVVVMTQSNGNKLNINSGDGNISRANSLNVPIDLSLQASGGNVGIGTTAPTAKLTVVGNISATGTITGSNLVYTTNTNQSIDGLKTFLQDTAFNGAVTSTGKMTANGQGSVSNLGDNDVMTRSHTDYEAMMNGNQYRQMTNVNSQLSGTGSTAGHYNYLGMFAQVGLLPNSSASAYTYDNIHSHTGSSGAPLQTNKELDVFFHGVMFRVEPNTNWVSRINFGVGNATRVPPASDLVVATGRQWGTEFYYDGTNYVGRMYWYDTSINYGTPFVLPALTTSSWVGMVYSIRMRQTALGVLEFYINTPTLSQGGTRLSNTPTATLSATWTAVNCAGRHINFEVAGSSTLSLSANMVLRAATMFCKYN